VKARLPLDGRPWLRLLPLVLAAAALVLGVAAADAAPAKAPTIRAASTAHAVGKTSATSCNPEASSVRPSGPAQVTVGSFMETIRARGYLIAGVDQNTYHFGFLNPVNEQFEGFDIDMIRAVAQAIFGNSDPAHLHFKAISDLQREPDIVNRSVDIVAHTMTISCSRLKTVDFSSVYFDAHQMVLVLKDSKARSLADLRGQKVCATRGSDSLAAIVAAKAVPFSVAYWTDCLVLLQQGDVAAISTDDVILDGLHAQDPLWTKLIGPPLTNEPYGLAISKQHPDFVAFVNAVLEQLRTDGQWQASYAKWIGTPVHAPPPVLYKS
jgi:polar amino acid transport system substrate-binding protein